MTKTGLFPSGIFLATEGAATENSGGCSMQDGHKKTLKWILFAAGLLAFALSTYAAYGGSLPVF
jgi:hypothetical protein